VPPDAWSVRITKYDTLNIHSRVFLPSDFGEKCMIFIPLFLQEALALSGTAGNS